MLLAFLGRIERAITRGRNIYMILDNYDSHPKVPEWFVAHPNCQLHFTLTGVSWLKLLERWFAEITRKHIRGGTFHSITEFDCAVSESV